MKTTSSAASTMSVERSHILCKSKKLNSTTVFLINLYVNGFVPRGTAQEIRDLIVLFAYAKGDYNTSGTFVADTAGWQMQIDVSLTESKINKFVNSQMSKNNVPVYLPYVVERKWTIKKLKQSILKTNGIDSGLHDEYTLWVWRHRIYARADYGYKYYTYMYSPDVDDNMQMKPMYLTGNKGYCAMTEGKGCKTIDRKLKTSEKYTLSKDKPQHKEEANLYGWDGCKKYYTKAELFKLWGGKDLTEKDHYHYLACPTWFPLK